MDTNVLKNLSTQMIQVSLIDLNNGQVEGLPCNPRKWSDENIELLKNSLDQDPEFMNYNPIIVYPHEGRFVVIGGNMRISVCKERGVSEVPCMILPETTPVEKLMAYTIKDNTTFGDWDWLALEEWDTEKLKEWGMEDWMLPDAEKTNIDDFFEEAQNTDNEKDVTISIIIPKDKKEIEDEIRDKVEQIAIEYGNLKTK